MSEDSAKKCVECSRDFGMLLRKHHCRGLLKRHTKERGFTLEDTDKSKEHESGRRWMIGGEESNRKD
eukprot:741004-Amorphochlora_amoeboformis.AAC.1